MDYATRYGLPYRLSVAGMSVSCRTTNEAEMTAAYTFARESRRIGRPILYTAEIVQDGRVIAHVVPSLCALQILPRA